MRFESLLFRAAAVVPVLFLVWLGGFLVVGGPAGGPQPLPEPELLARVFALGAVQVALATWLVWSSATRGLALAGRLALAWLGLGLAGLALGLAGGGPEASEALLPQVMRTGLVSGTAMPLLAVLLARLDPAPGAAAPALSPLGVAARLALLVVLFALAWLLGSQGGLPEEGLSALQAQAIEQPERVLGASVAALVALLASLPLLRSLRGPLGLRALVMGLTFAQAGAALPWLEPEPSLSGLAGAAACMGALGLLGTVVLGTRLSLPASAARR